MFQSKILRQSMVFVVATAIASTSFAAFRCEDVTENFHLISELFFKDKGTRPSPPPPPPPPAGGAGASGINSFIFSKNSDLRFVSEIVSRAQPAKSGIDFEFIPFATTFSKLDLGKERLRFHEPKIKIRFVDQFRVISRQAMPILFEMFSSDKGGPKIFRLEFSSGQSREFKLSEKSQLSAFGLDGMKVGSLNLSADASILLIGEGITGDIFSTLKNRGFRNVRSVDKIYDDKSLDTLAQHPDTKSQVEALRRLMQQHPNDITQGDATNFERTEKPKSQDLILAHNLFDGMDHKSVNKILNGAVHMLAPGRRAIFTFNENDADARTATTMWSTANGKSLRLAGYSVHVVIGKLSYLEIIAPKNQMADTGDGKQPPATAQLLVEVSSGVEALMKPAVEAAKKAGLETSLFMRNNKLTQQEKLDFFKRFLEIFFPNLVDQPHTKQFKLALQFFEELVVAPYNLGLLEKVEENLRKLLDARIADSLYISRTNQTQYLTTRDLKTVHIFTHGGGTTQLGTLLTDMYGPNARRSQRDTMLNLEHIKWMLGKD